MDAVSKYKPKKNNEVKLKCYLNKEDNGNKLGSSDKRNRFRKDI